VKEIVSLFLNNYVLTIYIYYHLNSSFFFMKNVILFQKLNIEISKRINMKKILIFLQIKIGKVENKKN